MSVSSSKHGTMRIPLQVTKLFSTILLLLGATFLVIDTSHATNVGISITKFGAVGDGNTDDTKAFLDAWEAACSGQIPPVVVVPEGTNLLLRPIKFEGPCAYTVNIKIFGNFVAYQDTKAYYVGNDVQSWLVFSNISGLVIDGNGKIDARGSAWWPDAQSIERRPTTIVFDHVENLRMDGLTVMNGAQNHIGIYWCEDVVVSNLLITAPESSPNTDGINLIWTTNAWVHDCTIATGDDCVSVSTGSSNITVNDVTCGPGHGISIGSLGGGGSEATVEDVRVRNCVFKGSTNGARIKTWQGGSGYARNIVYEDIELHSVQNPIIIDQYYCDASKNIGCENQTSAVKVSDIYYNNIRGTSSTEDAITLKCSQSVSCSNIVLKDIDISLDDTSKAARSSCFNANGQISASSKPNVDCLVLVKDGGDNGEGYNGNCLSSGMCFFPSQSTRPSSIHHCPLLLVLFVVLYFLLFKG